MTVEKFKEILDKPESTILDFKNEEYDFSRNATEAKKSEFIKDIISFSNTIRTESAYIIIGIKSFENGDKELNGVDKITDDSILQQKIKSNTIPHPIFSYSSFKFDGKNFGIIEIPVKKYDFPITALTKMKGLEPGKIYFRRGTSNSEANGIESINISNWFKSLLSTNTNAETTLHKFIANVILKLTKRDGSLSKVISECLTISKEYNLKKLENFCYNELTGWKKAARRNYQFRSSMVLITPLNIEFPNFSNLTAAQILKDMEGTDGIYENRLYFKQPIIEIEESIEKLNAYSLATMKVDGKTFFEDETKSHITITYYLSAQNFINVHNNIRQKLIDLLLEI